MPAAGRDGEGQADTAEAAAGRATPAAAQGGLPD